MSYRSIPPVTILVLLFATTSCHEDPGPHALPLETRADSVAMQVYEYFGGSRAWAALPYLRFDFATGTESSRTLRASHLWNRTTGDYRLETPAGQDSVYVTLFNVHTQQGSVYLNGERVEEGRAAELLQSAYRRFINDTYWFLMPVKMFDPGVSRSYEADSSDAQTDVLRLSFEGVGLTPGDQYWIYVDRETGRVERWAYRLQSHPPDHVPAPLRWTDYRTIETAAGPIRIAERKVGSASAIYTDNVAAPASVDDGAFSDPNPRLRGT